MLTYSNGAISSEIREESFFYKKNNFIQFKMKKKSDAIIVVVTNRMNEIWNGGGGLDLFLMTFFEIDFGMDGLIGKKRRAQQTILYELLWL